jgi:hypothetical protein
MRQFHDNVAAFPRAEKGGPNVERQAKVSASFLKKEAKTFDLWGGGQATGGATDHGLKEQKFFGSFFQKRTSFFLIDKITFLPHQEQNK